MRLRRLLRWPLAPLGWAYGVVVSVRNLFYDRGWLKSESHSLPVVCIGNITVGGTGKTPLTDFILSRQKEIFGDLRVAVVSRGYGRKTRGQVVASEESTAESIGDEPMMLYERHRENGFILNGDRNAAIAYAKEQGYGAVLMDDGMQHRSTKAKVYVAVCDYNRPLWDDMMLPAGDLREPWRGVRRASVVVVNKCPDDMKQAEAEGIAARFKEVGVENVFFATIDYGMLVSPRGREVECATCCPVVAVSGVASPKPFHDQLRRMFDEVYEMSFPDHHTFSEADVRKISAKHESLGEDAICVCTEKDIVRMPRKIRSKMFTLPIRTKLLFGQEELFIKTIHEYVHR